MASKGPRRKKRKVQPVHLFVERGGGKKPKKIVLKHEDPLAQPPGAPRTQNMVSTGKWLTRKGRIDLSEYAHGLGGYYNPAVFPACITRVGRYPRVTVSHFGTESIVCAGAKSEPDIVAALHLLRLQHCRRTGEAVQIVNFTRQNVVGNAYLGFRVDLVKLYHENSTRCQLVPDDFAGLGYTVADNHRIVVFESGSVVITGYENEGAVWKAFCDHVEFFRKYRLPKSDV
jgi:TATA-box binding protein (TBP) (component of TFIID and TFIIIB)